MLRFNEDGKGLMFEKAQLEHMVP